MKEEKDDVRCKKKNSDTSHLEGSKAAPCYLHCAQVLLPLESEIIKKQMKKKKKNWN